MGRPKIELFTVDLNASMIHDHRDDPEEPWVLVDGEAYPASPADLVAAVREAMESGTIGGEVAVICTTHGAKAYKGDPGEWRLCLYAADRGWGNCRLKPHLIIGPVSDGGSET